MSIVFFWSLKKGLSDSYNAEADKAGMHPTAVKAMNNIEAQYGDILNQIRKEKKSNK